MRIIDKKDFIEFVNLLITKDARTVVGVKAKGDKFIYDELASADELRLDFDVTVLSPKKYFMPPTETLLEYDLSSDFKVMSVNEVTPLIIIGIHPYDLIALQQMETVFRDTYPDANHLLKLERSILIGTNMQNVSPHSFAASMGTATTRYGYDLMLTDIGDSYYVELGSDRGEELLERYARVSMPDESHKKRFEAVINGIVGKFQKKLNFPADELPAILAKTYDSDLWANKAEKCLSCGSCNLVCPTCYCFDVQDVTELNLRKGERIRTWDGCLLEDFAKVATGENFREDRASRYRHRFMRKGKFLHERFGFIACVGCGRCASGCLPDIADPVEVYNTLKEEVL